jgi:hypothetical protein
VRQLWQQNTWWWPNATETCRRINKKEKLKVELKTVYFSVYEVKHDDRDWPFIHWLSTLEKLGMNVKVRLRKHSGSSHLWDLIIDGELTLKWMLVKYVVKIWTTLGHALIAFYFLWTRKWTLRFHKSGISLTGWVTIKKDLVTWSYVHLKRFFSSYCVPIINKVFRFDPASEFDQ